MAWDVGSLVDSRIQCLSLRVIQHDNTVRSKSLEERGKARQGSAVRSGSQTSSALSFQRRKVHAQRVIQFLHQLDFFKVALRPSAEPPPNFQDSGKLEKPPRSADLGGDCDLRLVRVTHELAVPNRKYRIRTVQIHT